MTTRDNSRRLVIDSALGSSWASVDELDGGLGLDGGNSSVDVLRHNVPAEHMAARHVLSVGSHLASIDAGSKAELVISATESCSWYAFSTKMTDDRCVRRNQKMGAGVSKLVSNSVISTLRAPSIEAERRGQ